MELLYLGLQALRSSNKIVQGHASFGRFKTYRSPLCGIPLSFTAGLGFHRNISCI